MARPLVNKILPSVIFLKKKKNKKIVRQNQANKIKCPTFSRIEADAWKISSFHLSPMSLPKDSIPTDFSSICRLTATFFRPIAGILTDCFL